MSKGKYVFVVLSILYCMPRDLIFSRYFNIVPCELISALKCILYVSIFWENIVETVFQDDVKEPYNTNFGKKYCNWGINGIKPVEEPFPKNPGI